MNWKEEQNYLTEQLEVLKKLRDQYGKEVIEIASKAKLNVHEKWMKQLSKQKTGRPSEIFKHSAYSVTSAGEDLLEYEILEDSEVKFAVKVTKCKYADFYIKNGEQGIGYSMHCELDFGETKAFSSDIILKRTKTLMQGDQFCNHCYMNKK